MFTGIVKTVRTKTFRNRSLIALSLLVVFTLGLLIGNGQFQIHARSQYKSETGLPATLNYSTVSELYSALKQNYNGKLTEEQLLNGIKHGMAAATGDPYTAFFTAEEANAFDGQLQGTFSGIGAQLELDDAGNVVVMSPLVGSPAAAADLRAKDIIVSIDGVSTTGMSANDAVSKIRGKKGTQVKLEIVRDKQPLTLTITRDTIQIPTATSKIIDGNIGYLQVSQFSDGTFALVQKAVASFQQAGVKSVILDLRDNPGGEVTTAQNISSLWLKDNALIMQERRGTQVIDSYKATGTNSLLGMPTVVLMNAGSASASEITALALRDNKAATIIGATSYGKGVVQQILPLSAGAQLKVTVAKWYSPNGTNINKTGIKPDQAVVVTDADYKAGTDPQLAAAEAYLNKQ